MYRYRCGQCAATGRPVPTRDEAEQQRAVHRRIAHGGLVPPGESIDRVPGGTPVPGEGYLSSWRALALLALLAIASVIARSLGH